MPLTVLAFCLCQMPTLTDDFIYFFACNDTSAIKRRRLINPTPSIPAVRRLNVRALLLQPPRRWPTQTPVEEARPSLSISLLSTRSVGASNVITGGHVIADCARVAEASVNGGETSSCRLPAGKIKEPRLKRLREEKDNQSRPIHAGATALIPRHILR